MQDRGGQGARSDAAIFKFGDLTVTSAQIWTLPAGDKVAAGYLKITNTGTAPDRFVSATSDMARRAEIRACR
jgi:copper(I)-binding protein